VPEKQTSDNRLIIALTGGIASGKSTVASFFADLGVPVIDTDIVAREVVAPGSPAVDEIRDRFGDGVIDDDGSLKRRDLREIIFADDDKRSALEAILHPRIRKETWRQAAEADGPYVIVVVPLLYESPMKSEVDRVLVVDCDPETQIERLMSRDNESREQACRILATQASRDERLSIADDIVSNDSGIDSAREQVEALHLTYLELAADKSN
jgi:dephospho-CoA kinase